MAAAIAVAAAAEPTPKPEPAVDELFMRAPDDWHLHLRDGAQLESLLRIPLQCRRAIIMPNLRPPVVTTELAVAYRERIFRSLPEGSRFEPLMTLYLTDQTTPEEIVRAKESGVVVACKLYPAGATTNSDSGVTDVRKIYPTLHQMAESGILLLVHGEVGGDAESLLLPLAAAAAAAAAATAAAAAAAAAAVETVLLFAKH